MFEKIEDLCERKFDELTFLYPLHESIKIDYELLFASYFVKEFEKKPNATILDIGTGIGTKAIYISFFIKNSNVVGINLKRELVKIAVANVEKNNLNIDMFYGNLRLPPPRIAAGTFDYIITTIPNEKDLLEFGSTLDLWVRFSLLMLRPSGQIFFMIPIGLMHHFFFVTFGKITDLKILPIWNEDKNAKFIIIKGMRKQETSIVLSQGISLL